MTIPAKGCHVKKCVLSLSHTSSAITLTLAFHIELVCQYGWYCNLLQQWGYKMLDRTWKRVGHGREICKKGEQEEEKWEKYQPTRMACDRVSY